MPRLTSRRSLSLVALVLAGSLLSSAALAAPEVPSVLNSFWAGIELFKGSLKGVGKTKDIGTNSISIDGAGDFVYNTPNDFDIDGSLIQDEKKLFPTLSGTGVDALEDAIADLIASTLLGLGIDPGVVTIDILPEDVKLKGKVKATNEGNFLLFILKAKYTGNSTTLGGGKGAFAAKGVMQPAI